MGNLSNSKFLNDEQFSNAWSSIWIELDSTEDSSTITDSSELQDKKALLDISKGECLNWTFSN